MINEREKTTRYKEHLKFEAGDKVKLTTAARGSRRILKEVGIPEVAVLTVEDYDSDFYDKAVIIEELKGTIHENHRIHETFLEPVFAPSRAKKRRRILAEV